MFSFGSFDVLVGFLWFPVVSGCVLVVFWLCSGCVLVVVVLTRWLWNSLLVSVFVFCFIWCRLFSCGFLMVSIGFLVGFRIVSVGLVSFLFSCWVFLCFVFPLFCLLISFGLLLMFGWFIMVSYGFLMFSDWFSYGFLLCRPLVGFLVCFPQFHLLD